MREGVYDFDFDPGAGGSFNGWPPAVDSLGHEAAISHEKYTIVPVVEYDLNDLQPIREYPAYLTVSFDLEDFEDSDERKIWDQKMFRVLAEEGELPVLVCDSYSDQKSHLVANRDDGKTRIISPAFDELLEVSPAHIKVSIDDRIFQITRGKHETLLPKHPFTTRTLPHCLESNYSVLISEIVPTDQPENILMNPDTDHWQILEAPAPEKAEIEKMQGYANQLFEKSIEAIFAHVERHSDKYSGLEDSRSAIHLPAVSIDGKYYQFTTSSSELGTTLIAQRVQPGSTKDSIGDALERMTTEEFITLIDNPEALESLYDEALAEGKLLITQPPYGDVLIIGGDDYEKRLDVKDAPYTPIIFNTANLVKAYLEELERLPMNTETLFDKRRALAGNILALQTAETQPEGRLKRAGKHLLRLFLEN